MKSPLLGINRPFSENNQGCRNFAGDRHEPYGRMEPRLLERTDVDRSFVDLDAWMQRYQQGDPEAPGVLIAAVSPGLMRLFRGQLVSRQQADDLLQDTWLRIHRVRHTYRPGEPVLPWIYAIARRVRIDGYSRMSRIMSHETTMDALPDAPAATEPRDTLPAFETLVADLPESQREVITMLKVGGLSLEEVARATSSTIGAVKQKAHRAYDRLRKVLQPDERDDGRGGA
jgi:RNA polymerase sigma-70 factor, ECF subfamily